MALTITVDKRLDVTVDGETNPTVILGLIPGDSTKPEDVYELVQTSELTQAGIAVRPYGLVVIPGRNAAFTLYFVCKNIITGATTRMAVKSISQLTQGSTIAVAS